LADTLTYAVLWLFCAVRFIDAEVFFWLFSTLAQTLGAIVGVGGMVSVYRMGQLRDGRWAIQTRLSEFSYMITEDAAPSATKLRDVWNKLLAGTLVGSKPEFKTKYDSASVTVTVEEDGKLTMRDVNNGGVPYENKTNVRADLSGLDRIVKNEKQFRRSFIRFLKVNLLIIGCSVGALLFSKALAAMPLVIILTFLLTVPAIIYSLMMTLDLCRKLIPPWSVQVERDQNPPCTTEE